MRLEVRKYLFDIQRAAALLTGVHGREDIRRLRAKLHGARGSAAVRFGVILAEDTSMSSLPNGPTF
jgi:hypothetical protein